VTEQQRRRPYVCQAREFYAAGDLGYEDWGEEWLCVTVGRVTVHPSKALAFRELVRSRGSRQRQPSRKRQEVRVTVVFSQKVSEAFAAQAVRQALATRVDPNWFRVASVKRR